MKSWLLIFVLASMAWAGNFTAATCNQSDVNAVINGPTHTAVDGDVINIPAGTCIWSSGISVPSSIGITIAGNGTPNSDGSTTGASSSCGNGTTLTLAGSFTAFTMTPQFGNSTTRLSCLVASYSSGGVVWAKILGTCTGSGCPNLRMDNVTFSNWAGHSSGGISFGLMATGDVFGVIDHNTVSGVSGNFLQLNEQSNASYLGVGSYGDNSWHIAENYGTANFLYYENNALNFAGLSEDEGSAGGSSANQGGCRIAGRFNTFTMDNLNVALAWHGTESNGRPRSCRNWEFYDNTLNCPASTQCSGAILVGSRGGTGLTWGNTVSFGAGAGVNSYQALDTYRAFASIGGWGPCDGSTVYDTNDGTTYYSDTVASGGGTNTITVSGSPGWTVNQWVSNGSPYSLHDVTKSNGNEITANGSNTLTLSGNAGPGAWTPSNGDSIQILRATVCIDQAGGRGAGILYSGTVASPSSPANEAVSPSYLWTLTGNTPGVSIIFSDTARVIQNRDYYNENINQAAQTTSSSPFDGTTTIGFGHGTLARRPTTCTTGVGYWATDQGNWNSSGSGGQGVLYLCTGTNTWTLSYTPYTYPHPLESGGNPPVGSAFGSGIGIGPQIPWH